MRSKRRSIVLLINGGALGVLLVVVGVAGWFVSHHRTSVAVSAQGAETEFSQLRARFAHERPLLDMDRRQASASLGNAPRATSLHSFHTVIFDTRGGQRIVRINVPYWFARRFAGRDREFKWLGQLTFLDDTEFDPEAIRLSLDQLEQRGRGLVAYYQRPGGGQFISWVE